MKALCIIGSPKTNGSTARLVDRVIEGMRSQQIKVSRYVLDEMNINYCKGCEKCEDNRKCVQIDDMNLLIDEIYESDIVLLASPSYWGDVTGQMKTFIDRSLPLCNAKTGETPVPKEKFGVTVAVRAGNSKEENQHIVDTFNHYFGHLGIQPIAVLTAEGIRSIADLENDQTKLEEAYNLGQKLKSNLKLFEQDA
jgi:multimeric flavodoxin WrbA